MYILSQNSQSSLALVPNTNTRGVLLEDLGFFLKAGNGLVLINNWSKIYKQVLNVIDTLENGPLSKLQVIQRNQVCFSSSSNILTQAAINQFDERKNLHI